MGIRKTNWGRIVWVVGGWRLGVRCHLVLGVIAAVEVVGLYEKFFLSIYRERKKRENNLCNALTLFRSSRVKGNHQIRMAGWLVGWMALDT
ncbi:uncharacterized protein F4817DRAFT_330907 [Daldinia loculata]|uniref:uncharacterized protein n=1 Tax=Daldinia loculata TaxID=103429 RepID=UPI0020C4A85D|nr:uncharacterized protein F4817DRAFT_330907 [Daldinia loculata]KAI1649613.1 hypothetical protein F4817DRAFT_330907 [Daldinia loculata]